MMFASGENDPVRVLGEFECEAIVDPSLQELAKAAATRRRSEIQSTTVQGETVCEGSPLGTGFVSALRRFDEELRELAARIEGQLRAVAASELQCLWGIVACSCRVRVDTDAVLWVTAIRREVETRLAQHDAIAGERLLLLRIKREADTDFQSLSWRRANEVVVDREAVDELQRAVSRANSAANDVFRKANVILGAENREPNDNYPTTERSTIKIRKVV